MLVLPYCFALDHKREPAPPQAGLWGAAVLALSAGDLVCWWSPLATDAASFAPGQEEALQFHRVVQHFAAQRTVIPFRFPTVLEDEAALRRFLEENANDYQGALTRLEGLVQMEVVIQEEPRGTAETAEETSGRAYLRARQARALRLTEAAEGARRAAGDSLLGWRQRETAAGMRCFALLPRAAAVSLQARLAELPAPGLRVRLTGPWPPAEFLEEHP